MAPFTRYLLALALVPLGLSCARGETAEQKASRMAWFEAARFGMFIHWGVYAEAGGVWDGAREPRGGGEWIMERMKIPTSQYATMIPKFDPEKFNAAEWVRIAKDAGMKYLVITSKHHDGFAMWPTSVRPAWSIGGTPFHRDPLKELAEECRKQGIVFCLYYSIMDWRNPNYTPRRAWNDLAAQEGPTNYDRYREDMKTELKEIITNYGPLGILWFDGEWEPTWTHADAVDLERYVRSLEPSIIINNRIDNTRAGMHGMSKDAQALGDYGTPEQQIPPQGFGPGVDWESCMTMNGTWGYKSWDHDWKSTATLIRNLVDCASKGGNFLLNVGPTGDGVIPDASQERLAQMGAWLRVNGEAIYGTSASPYSQAFAWGRCTATPSALYVHIFDWPKGGELTLPTLPGRSVASAELLGATGSKVSVAGSSAGMAITLPQVAPDAVDTVVKITFAGASQARQLPPPNHDFDFWVGDWTVADAQGHPQGTSRIEAVSDGYGLLENWTPDPRGGGGPGKSLNAYNRATGKWQQFWIGYGGGVLELSGGPIDGKMVLSGEHTVRGKTIRERITWTPNSEGTVRQFWEQSTDGGATWQTAFDGIYTRRPPTT